MKAFLALFLILSSCATMSDCPTAEQERVSNCRAEITCGKGSVRLGLAAFFGGMGSGMNHTRDSSMDNYHNCVDREMSAQMANAGIQDNSVKCVSEKVSDDRVETRCH